MNVYNIDSEFLFYYHVNSISVKSGLLGECTGFDNLSDWQSLPRNSLDNFKKSTLKYRYKEGHHCSLAVPCRYCILELDSRVEGQ